MALNTPVIDFIKNAILQRQPVCGKYQGLLRKICPHILGYKNGVAHALCWQYGGQSKKGGLPEWRCIPITELTELRLLDEPWQTSPNYSVPLQSCVDEVVVCV